MEKRRKLMQEYEDLRKLKQDQYAAQRRRRIELRNSKLIIFVLALNPITLLFFS